MTRARPVVNRIREKCIVDTETGCWIFTGSHNWGGYGKISYGKRTDARLVHRVMYEQVVGEIPNGLDLDHLCRNRACCNPDHLEPVTRSVNLSLGIGFGAYNARKTHCPEGHPYDEQNTYITPSGGRMCRRCCRQEFRDLRAARKASP